MIIEKVIFDYLKEKLDVPVYMEMPSNAEIPCVWLEKTASGLEEKHLYNATFAIQSYGETLYKTAQLNEEIVEKMLDIIEIDKISECNLNTAYNYPDTTKKLYRYQAVFDLKYLK